jgi:hypothetical protein
MMMAMMGMLPMVAMLMKSQSPVVGFMVHLVISAGIGAVYGLVASRLPKRVGTGIVAGAVNGVIWWVLGALILMPLMLGMGDMVLTIDGDQWVSCGLDHCLTRCLIASRAGLGASSRKATPASIHAGLPWLQVHSCWLSPNYPQGQGFIAPTSMKLAGKLSDLWPRLIVTTLFSTP